MNDRDLTPPEPSLGDRIHVAVMAGVSAIPFAGGPAAELLGAVLPPPLYRRRDEWNHLIADAISDIRHRLPERFEGLQDDEDFISVVVQATQAALRASRSEKRRLLAVAVRHSAEGFSTDFERQSIFVRYLDELTMNHINLLL